MKNIFLAIVVIITLVSCNTINNLKSKLGTKQSPINNTQWILADQVKGNSPTLIIEKGKISGNAGCNDYFSTDINLEPNVGNFSAKNVGSTRKTCNNNMSVETNFLNMLQQANKYLVSENSLELYKDKLLLLRFNKKL